VSGTCTSVAELPWWADASDNNTVDIASLPSDQHKMKIELVGPNHKVFAGQVTTLRFTVLGGQTMSREGRGH